MNNKYKILIITLLVPLFLINFNLAFAVDTNPPVSNTPVNGNSLANGGTYNFAKDSGLKETGTKAAYSKTLRDLTPSKTISQGIQIILNLLGVIFMGIMIYGGIVWMLAEGNEEEATKAKNIIVAGITGLVIVIAAYALTYFIVSRFSAGAINP